MFVFQVYSVADYRLLACFGGQHLELMTTVKSKITLVYYNSLGSLFNWSSLWLITSIKVVSCVTSRVFSLLFCGCRPIYEALDLIVFLLPMDVLFFQSNKSSWLLHETKVQQIGNKTRMFEWTSASPVQYQCQFLCRCSRNLFDNSKQTDFKLK